jgi:hypothetical protein
MDGFLIYNIPWIMDCPAALLPQSLPINNTWNIIDVSPIYDFPWIMDAPFLSINFGKLSMGSSSMISLGL